MTFTEDDFSGANIATANFPGIVKRSLRSMFTDVNGRKDKKLLYSLVSPAAAYALQDMGEEDPKLIGTTQKVWVL